MVFEREPVATEQLRGEERVDFYRRLLENRAEGAFRHVARVIWDGRIFVDRWIVPDFVRTRCLPQERKPKDSQFADDVAISEAS